jgi:hypothetical protein
MSGIFSSSSEVMGSPLEFTVPGISTLYRYEIHPYLSSARGLLTSRGDTVP